INKANLVIEGVNEARDEGIISDEEADDYIGQAKFLRAITHFELNKMYARPYNHSSDQSHLGVVLRDKPIDDEERLDEADQQGRSTVGEVYEHVINDLNDAEEQISGAHWSDVLHVSSNAAIAFKTRVYLHMR